MGEVAGRRLLHFRRHFGLDTPAFARRGATVTGVDLSPEAVSAARRLADETELDAGLAESTIEEPPDHLEGRFDVVLSSWGVLPWLGDLSRSSEVIARFLAPGGVFALVEAHPVSRLYDCERDDDRLEVIWSCFVGEPYRCEGSGSYADPGAPLTHVTYERMHTLSEIVGSLLGAGLTLESFRECPRIRCQTHPFLVPDGDGSWRMPEGIPLSFPSVSRSARSRRP